MSGPVRVIAVGQRAAGDDGVAFAVLEELRHRGADLDLLPLADPSGLIEALAVAVPVIVVDAAAATPGQVFEFDPAPPQQRASLLSSHGIGVVEAIALARTLHAGAMCPSLHIVAIGIAEPPARGDRLSPEIAAAVAVAADRVLALARA